MGDCTVSFFGHRQLRDSIAIERELEKIIKTILREYEYITFLVGRDGEFDLLAASTVLRCKRKHGTDNSTLTWVLPYPKSELTQAYQDYDAYYDAIEICEYSERKHYKAAFGARNENMVRRSDIVIVCVEHNYGGAYKAKQYAEKLGKQVINVSQLGTHY